MILKNRRTFLLRSTAGLLSTALYGCGGGTSPTSTQTAGTTGVTQSELQAALSTLRSELETQWMTVRDQLTATTSESITSLESAMSELETIVTNNHKQLTSSLSALANSLTEVSDSLALLPANTAAQLSSLQNKVETLETSKTATETDMVQIRGDIATLAIALQNVNGVNPTVVTALQTALQQLDTTVSSNQTQLQQALSAVQARLDQLETDFTQLSGSVPAQISGLQIQIDALTASQSATTAAITQMQSDLTSLSNTVATHTTQISGLNASLQSAITSLQRYISVKDYGAVGDGTTDDTAAFRLCIADAFTKTSSIFVPPGTYLITDRLKCWLFTNGIGRRSVQFLGGGGSNIRFRPAAENSVCFEHAEAFGFHNISVAAVQANNSDHWGVAFSTPVNTTTLEPSNAQSAFSRFSNVKVRGKFKYGFYRRFSLWDSYESIDSRDQLCHFMFALFSSYDTPLNDPGTGWNGGSNGWFHNQASFDNVLTEAGEVGIMGGLMGANFIQLTCQGHAGRGVGWADNTILPANEPGTGVWLQGRSAADPCRGNTFGAYYTEVTDRPLKFVNCAPVTVNTMFVQGLTVAGNTAVAPTISLDSGSINVLAATVRGRFTHFINAVNNSKAIVQMVDGGWFTNGKLSFDSSSSALDLDNIEHETVYRLTRANGIAAEDITLFTTTTSKNYDVRIYGSANGGNVDSLYSLQGTTLTYVAAADRGANTGNFAAAAGFRGIRLSVTNSQLRISRTTTSPCDLYISVERKQITTLSFGNLLKQKIQVVL